MGFPREDALHGAFAQPEPAGGVVENVDRLFGPAERNAAGINSMAYEISDTSCPDSLIVSIRGGKGGGEDGSRYG